MAIFYYLIYRLESPNHMVFDSYAVEVLDHIQGLGSLVLDP